MLKSAFSRLLASTALVLPSAAAAQSAVTPAPGAVAPVAAENGGEGVPASPAAPAQPAAQQIPPAAEVSIPGGEAIVVTGRRRSNVQQASDQVVNVVTTEAIAKTGAGDIAGALQRVTGLSVVGNGYVYVRGLGDRYSLALLNGSPLPSPEPLKRVVPLDLFPTNIIASSLVQKSYSPNFPGEFGGGVINLTTRAVPDKPFIQIGAGASYDTETTDQIGYTYYGSKYDWSGFDSGARDIPPALQDYFRSGQRISTGTVNTAVIAGQLIDGRNSLLQRNRDMPFNWSGNITGGGSIDIGDEARIGIIATAGYSTRFRTRDTVQQTAASADLSTLENNFRRVITDNRVVVNGLLGIGAEFGPNRLRWTNLYIRDTLKQARLGQGTRQTTSATATLLQQNTAWFERQLVDTQLVAELRPISNLTLDLRGSYANSQREAPDEVNFEYYRSNNPADPLGDVFINRLNNGQQGSASIQFSDLNEDLWSGGVDLGYRFSKKLRVTMGYAFVDTRRRTEVRAFQFVAPSDFPAAVGSLMPHLLLQPAVIDYFGIRLIDTNEANPVFDARLRNHAGYGQVNLDFGKVKIDGGVRYEKARQRVSPVKVFNDPIGSLAGTDLNNRYWLPAVTLTVNPIDRLQLRVSASKTIARPQFRELIFQPYTDPDSNRQFRGNPLLVDSVLKNVEARAEYWLRGEQRIAIAGFFKDIDKPIEAYASFSDNAVLSSFVNAPRARLYGFEAEALKWFSIGDVWGPRRLVVNANYTWSQSELRIKDGDPALVFGSPNNFARDYFSDGDPMTGQSKHLVNVEVGFEHEDRLSQQTLLLSYASPRVTNRGAGNQPDIVEKPGVTLDFVAREGFKLFNRTIEVKLEARNLLRRRYQEFQSAGDRQVFYNRYRLGTTLSLGASVRF